MEQTAVDPILWVVLLYKVKQRGLPKKALLKLFLLKKRAFFAALPKQVKVLWGKNEQKQKVQRRDYWLLQQPAISQICNICNPPPPNNDFKQYAASNLSNQQFALEEYLR